MRRHQAAEKRRRDEDLRGPTAVAQRKIVRDDRDQPFARAVNDPRRHHPGRVAAEAHHHAHGLLAVRAGLLEDVVQVERHARQIAKILQQVNSGKKIAIGGSITLTTQAVARYMPSIRKPVSHHGKAKNRSPPHAARP
jgi:hypothetical protein